MLMDPDPSQQQARLHQAVLNLQQEESSPKARLFFKWANPGLFSVYFCSFLITISIQIEKSIDGVLGIRTRGRRMVGADKTTELWRPSGVRQGLNLLWLRYLRWMGEQSGANTYLGIDRHLFRFTHFKGAQPQSFAMFCSIDSYQAYVRVFYSIRKRNILSKLPMNLVSSVANLIKILCL